MKVFIDGTEVTISKNMIKAMEKHNLDTTDTITEIVALATYVKQMDKPGVRSGKYRFKYFEESLAAAITIALGYTTEEYLLAMVEDFTVAELYQFIYETDEFLMKRV